MNADSLRVRAALFRHEAFFYSGDDEYLGHATGFIRDGLSRREAVLVAVPPAKIELLRSALNGEAERVAFVDITEVGRNPLRIIPMWRDFVDLHCAHGRAVRGIGEPIWAGRTPAELVEAQRHEALINLAFHEAAAWILCPYDVRSLDRAVLDEANRSHPGLVAHGMTTSSPSYTGLESIEKPFDHPLPAPPARPKQIRFDNADSLRAVRAFVSQAAASFGVDATRARDLVLAVDEVATNSLRHARSGGIVRAWTDDGSAVFEVLDHGRIDGPLVGRHRPEPAAIGGFGLWIVNQVCDLVQIRSFPTGSVVRMHVGLGARVGR